MNASEEKFYDEEIAPLLARVSELCQQRGLPFIALVEYAPGENGRTEFLPEEGAGFAQRLAHWAARAHGNVDSLMIAVARYAEQHGHSSAVLHRLGIAAQKEEKPRG